MKNRRDFIKWLAVIPFLGEFAILKDTLGSHPTIKLLKKWAPCYGMVLVPKDFKSGEIVIEECDFFHQLKFSGDAATWIEEFERRVKHARKRALLYDASSYLKTEIATHGWLGYGKNSKTGTVLMLFCKSTM